MNSVIINNKSSNKAFDFLPKAKSNFELVSSLNVDVYDILLHGCFYYPKLIVSKDNLFQKLKEDFSKDNLINWSKHYKIENPESSELFNLLVNKLAAYFNINVLATRLNYYTENDYKPFHHDSHAFSNGLKEDITIGLSIGDTRSLNFKHVETGNIFYFPQYNGDVFCFDHKTNIKFQHGIAPVKVKNKSERFSIIMWGKKND